METMIFFCAYIHYFFANNIACVRVLVQVWRGKWCHGGGMRRRSDVRNAGKGLECVGEDTTVVCVDASSASSARSS